MPPEEEVHARHILVSTEDEAKAIIADLKKGTAFDKLAKEKSTDKASGAEGGDLGWFKKSDMVKEFADAAFDLKKGQTSGDPDQDPVRLPRHFDRRPPHGAAAGPGGALRADSRGIGARGGDRPARQDPRRLEDREVQHGRHQGRGGARRRAGSSRSDAGQARGACRAAK